MRTPESLYKKVAVIIPCYNEAASIAQVIAKFPLEKLEP